MMLAISTIVVGILCAGCVGRAPDDVRIFYYDQFIDPLRMSNSYDYPGLVVDMMESSVLSEQTVEQQPIIDTSYNVDDQMDHLMDRLDQVKDEISEVSHTFAELKKKIQEHKKSYYNIKDSRQIPSSPVKPDEAKVEKDGNGLDSYETNLLNALFFPDPMIISLDNDDKVISTMAAPGNSEIPLSKSGSNDVFDGIFTVQPAQDDSSDFIISNEVPPKFIPSTPAPQYEQSEQVGNSAETSHIFVTSTSSPQDQNEQDDAWSGYPRWIQWIWRQFGK